MPSPDSTLFSPLLFSASYPPHRGPCRGRGTSRTTQVQWSGSIVNRFLHYVVVQPRPTPSLISPPPPPCSGSPGRHGSWTDSPRAGRAGTYFCFFSRTHALANRRPPCEASHGMYDASMYFCFCTHECIKNICVPPLHHGHDVGSSLS